MKVKDLIEQEIDVDVYDNVCDDIGIAVCGPLKLTEEGLKKFGEVLNYRVKLHMVNGYLNAKVYVDDPADKGDEWESRLEKAREFFWSAAGYCPADDYEIWFEED